MNNGSWSLSVLSRKKHIYANEGYANELICKFCNIHCMTLQTSIVIRNYDNFRIWQIMLVKLDVFLTMFSWLQGHIFICSIVIHPQTLASTSNYIFLHAYIKILSVYHIFCNRMINNSRSPSVISRKCTIYANGEYAN